MTANDPSWWRQATVYQIYPRSFADDDGNGIGDLKGITSRVDYLQKLGIDAVWLSPFYPSALKDGGYDVADYKNIDPKIGTLEDFDEMVKALKAVDIKVIVDIVPNHTSNDHPWFQEALKSPRGSEARGRYHFVDGKGPDKSQPPNDWQCVFAGSSWEPTNDDTHQFYLHLFDVSQPDLNWSSPLVRSYFLSILSFWGDRGVSGFRIDASMAMSKDMSEKGLGMSEEEVKRLGRRQVDNGKERDWHPLMDREENFVIFREWRKVMNKYDPPLTAVAECYVSPDRVHLYASPDTLGQAFAFDLMIQPYRAKELRECVQKLYKVAREAGSTTTWCLSNHDVVRHATRYALPSATEPLKQDPPDVNAWTNELLKNRGRDCDYPRGLKRSRATTLMMLGLPGCCYLYQGEELGLPEVIDIPDSARQDPLWKRTKGEMIGRDGCRVPSPWKKTGKTKGFSPDSAGTAAEAWLPVPEWFGELSVEAQEADIGSTLEFYRKACNLRKKLRQGEEMDWIGGGGSGGEDYLQFRRPGGWEVIMNVGVEGGVKLPEGAEVLVGSGELEGDVVPIDVTVWLKV